MSDVGTQIKFAEPLIVPVVSQTRKTLKISRFSTSRLTALLILLPFPEAHSSLHAALKNSDLAHIRLLLIKNSCSSFPTNVFNGAAKDSLTAYQFR
jgi:hypothetical protein